MKRSSVIVLLVIMTLAAMMIAMGVAWACTIWSPRTWSSGARWGATSKHPLAVTICESGDFDLFTVWESEGFGWYKGRILAARSEYSVSSPLNRNRLEMVRAGWPLSCLEGEKRTITDETSLSGWKPLPDVWWARKNGVDVLPLRPRWGGAAGQYTVLWLAGVSVHPRAQRETTQAPPTWPMPEMRIRSTRP